MKNKHLCIWNPEELIKWKKLFSKLTDSELCIQKGLFVFPDRAEQMKNEICLNPAVKLKICEQRKKKVDYENFRVIMPQYIYIEIIDYYDELFGKQIIERNISFRSEMSGNDIEITNYKIHWAKHPFPTISSIQPNYAKRFIYAVCAHNHPYSYFRTRSMERVEPLGTCDSYLFLSENDIDAVYIIRDNLLEDDIKLDFWIEIIFIQFKKNDYSKEVFDYLTDKLFSKEYQLLETDKHYFITMAFIVPFVYYDSPQSYINDCSSKIFMIDFIVK